MINIILNIIILIIVAQLATISHEFGHAIPALIFTKDNVKIILGKEMKKKKEININRITLVIRGFAPFLGFVYWSSSRMTKFQKVLVTLGGPITSLVISLSLIFISKAIDNYIIKQIIIFSAIYHLFQCLFTIIPIKYPKWWKGYEGLPSDGYRVFKLIK